MEIIAKRIEDSIQVKQALLGNAELLSAINRSIEAIVHSFQQGNKVLFCGNGGSAADAQHLAAELSGRFYFDRPSLPAEACHVNSSYLTAVANDYSYDHVYARYVQGIGKKGDILIAISTSGNSKNIINAIDQAHNNRMLVISLTGESGGQMKDISDICINVPSKDTPRIQETHILIGHIICEQVEQIIFKHGS